MNGSRSASRKEASVLPWEGRGFPLSAGPVARAANHVIMPSNSATSLGSGIPLYLGSKTVGTTAGHAEVGTLHALGLTGAGATISRR